MRRQLYIYVLFLVCHFDNTYSSNRKEAWSLWIILGVGIDRLIGLDIRWRYQLLLAVHIHFPTHERTTKPFMFLFKSNNEWCAFSADTALPNVTCADAYAHIKARGQLAICLLTSWPKPNVAVPLTAAEGFAFVHWVCRADVHHDVTYGKKILSHFCWQLLSKTNMISNMTSKLTYRSRTINL